MELACVCLGWRYIPAKSGIRMELRPSVLNDNLDDFNADCFDADASTLVQETADEFFGKRGASDICNLFKHRSGLRAG